MILINKVTQLLNDLNIQTNEILIQLCLNQFINTIDLNMRRIFRQSLVANLLNESKFQYYKPKPELQQQCSVLKHSLFNKRSFPEIINLIKNPDNPYPKNSAYYYALLECILDESNDNGKIMMDYGQVIHVFLQQIMQRIKLMGAKELSEILALLRFRPKALRFDKQLLITMHVRFESRINQLIELNKGRSNVNGQQRLTMQDIRNQIEGLFYLKKNTTILNKILNFSYQMLKQHKQDPQYYSIEDLANEEKVFYSIIEVINDNLDDTIDPVRESIAEFVGQNYKNGTLPHNREILRMIVKCKFYKNYPIVRNEDWLHQYLYTYLQKVIKEEQTADIEEFVSVLKHITTYVMHIDPWSFEGFMVLLDEAYIIAKRNLLSISYINDKEQLSREVNTISHQIKLIPSYLYLKNYYKVSTIAVEDGNKVNSRYIKAVIQQIKPIILKFVLCYFQKVEITEKNGRQNIWLADSIDNNIEILNDIIKRQDEPQKLLLKSVENLLNTVTVFKDYNIIKIDVEFSLLLIETEMIYCILCRQWISDQVRYLRLLQHSVFVIGEFDKELTKGNPEVVMFEERITRIKSKMREELSIYDNTDKSYKQFTVLRLVAVLKCMNMQPKYLGDFYRSVKLKKPNIYVQTLSRTMLKIHNYQQVIEAFQLMFQGKIVVKEIELGRIVFLSSKQPQLLKYWMHTNRKHFISKICFCRRIINNIVSIIRMDNLQINRNSIQLLSQIVIQNKLFEIDNHSISNHQESNALKKILCNNFSILFRYSKMDSMIDDIFLVHKNIPTVFRNRFSHIEAIKIFTFSAYLAEEQSIFYINRQNKNALFKYVIMLMKKNPYCEKQTHHYLLNKRYNEQAIMLSVVDKIIEQYWPDNKLTNKGMPFYAEFLNYYTQINQFSHLVKNENTVFLIIKEILQDYRQVQNKVDLKYIISRMRNNYQRLHFLSIFQNQTNLNNTLENVISSMNFVMDVKIFGDFVKVVEGWIRDEISLYQQDPENNSKKQMKAWKKHGLDKHLINRMVVDSLQTLDEVSDYHVLYLMTVDVLVHGVRDVVNENMQLLIGRLVKINPIDAKLTRSPEDQQSQKKAFPFELFKLVMSNLNIYLTNREMRVSTGKEILTEESSAEKITEWMIKCLLTYARDIDNNEEIEHVTRYMNNWNIDILALIKHKFLDTKVNLHTLAHSYFNVEILSILWTQNIVRFNYDNNVPQNSQFSNRNIVTYIQVLLKEFEETHLMNNYGVYFQTEGEKVLNVIRSLLMTIIHFEPHNSPLFKEATQCKKIVRDLFEDFNKIANRAVKYNKLRNGGKYSYLYNQDQGDVVDMLAPPTRHKNRFSQETPDVASKSLKLFSTFSEILEIMSLIKFGKWSVRNVSEQHLELIKKINESISKRQKFLLINSELTYFTDTEPLIEEKVIQQFGLKLYVKKSPQTQSLVVYYLVNEKESLLYDFSYKKRRRLVGEEQLVIDYIESLINTSAEMEEEKNIRKLDIRVLPHHLSKAEFKKVFTGQTHNA